MPLDSIVFDLDGTLWDTTEACAVSWNAVLARHGIPYRTIVAHDVRLVTGRPHDDCIRETFTDLEAVHVELLVEGTATEDNEAIARLGGILYDGVAEGLQELSRSYPLFIVSNCQRGYIENFLDYSGFGEFFTDFECIGNTGQPKSENLRRVIERNGLRYPIMVGDTTGDETAARACGVPFVHVTYGFGPAEAPDYRIESFPELLTLAATLP
jgi:phosphoglycolate phosphatase